EAVEALLVRGDRLPQLGDARAGRVLVATPIHDRGGGRGGDLARPIGVREALAEVDRAGRAGQRRHLGEDRRTHPVEPGIQQWSVHPAMTSRPWPRLRPLPPPGAGPALAAGRDHFRFAAIPATKIRAEWEACPAPGRA